ncbi:MAG: molybdopterin synthase catalytic subunit [Phycisphaerales bacterium]
MTQVRVEIVGGPLSPETPSSAGPIEARGEIGSRVRFEGVVRRLEGEGTIEALDYEVYSPMAERVLESIARDEGRRSGVLGILVRHSRGRVAVGEVSFVCEIASAHRAEGLEALGSFIDRMKREAPIWKRPVPAPSD